MVGRLQLVARTGHPDFLDLPWEQPLEAWESERLVEVVRGISRHVVRFVRYEGAVYALKELPERLAHREYGLLRRLNAEGMPTVLVVGVVERADLDAVLITRHLDFSLPYRALFSRRPVTDLRRNLLRALAELLVRLHLAGFFWGDCSLSNTLFRRDAGQLSAYLVDAETGELHPDLTDGQRRLDLVIAEENIVGELLDVEAELGGLPDDVDPIETAEGMIAAYEALWSELTREEVFGPDERWRIHERLRRLNELGFDVDEIELVGREGEYRLRLDPRVVEPGHHRRRLLMLTGLDVQENQARRLLNDITEFRAHLEHEQGREIAESVAAYRWLNEVYQPTVDAVPEDLRGKLEPPEVFHQILNHKWYMSATAGHDVGIDEAVKSYLDTVLRFVPDEWMILPPSVDDEAEED
jgi:tRNA A-37 threonylcarbamoyl transferase component Bud32